MNNDNSDYYPSSVQQEQGQIGASLVWDEKEALLETQNMYITAFEELYSIAGDPGFPGLVSGYKKYIQGKSMDELMNVRLMTSKSLFIIINPKTASSGSAIYSSHETRISFPYNQRYRETT